MAWSLDGLARVWPNLSGLEASWCAGIMWPGLWLDATGPLPVSHFKTRFGSSTDIPDNSVQNQPGSDIVLADCVSFWQNGSGPEASLCARIIRSASGQCYPADPDRMRIGNVYQDEGSLKKLRNYGVYKNLNQDDMPTLFKAPNKLQKLNQNKISLFLSFFIVFNRFSVV